MLPALWFNILSMPQYSKRNMSWILGNAVMNNIQYIIPSPKSIFKYPAKIEYAKTTKRFIIAPKL